MLKNIKKGMFPFLIAFSALSVSASAAFYSVYGLSKLFAGAQFQVIIMAGSLEFAKLVTASLLYQYWDSINKTLRTYLTMATVVLVLITSMGIYGFLSAAYQETYSKLSIAENEIRFLENKKQFYEEDVARFDEELKKISENISVLSSAKASSIQVRDTSSTTGFRQTISTTELRLAADRIRVEEENRKNTYAKREIVADSLQKYQLKILELESNNEVSAELGPLQYLSGLTGTPMDKIINILLLIIIFVFDPLAISLVVAANFAFDQAYPRKKYKENLYGETVEDKPKKHIEITEEEINEELFSRNDNDLGASLEEQAEHTNWKEEYTEEDEKRMDVIAQNGNDGLHYEEVAKKAKEDNVSLTGRDGKEKDLQKYLKKVMSHIKIKKQNDDLTKEY